MIYGGKEDDVAMESTKICDSLEEDKVDNQSFDSLDMGNEKDLMVEGELEVQSQGKLAKGDSLILGNIISPCTPLKNNRRMTI